VTGRRFATVRSDRPYLVAEWRRAHPGQPIADGQIFIQPWVMGSRSAQADDLLPVLGRSGRRTLRGIDQQVAKAEKAVAGQAAVKRNRFVQLTGGTKASTVTWRPKRVPWPG
jgi:hypothetical protein